MKNIFGFLLLTFALGTGNNYAQSSAKAYIVCDLKTGHILDQSNPNQKSQVASLTKIATAMVAIDWAKAQKEDLNTTIIVPQSALAIGGVNPIGLAPGDSLSLRDLIYASLLQSDNIAAYTLASHIGGRLKELDKTSDPKLHSIKNADYFVRQMNALAVKLQMKKTIFLNPCGLDNVERPYSTAADMARLTRYAMEDAGFRFYVSQKERKISIAREGQSIEYLLKNTNELLGSNNIDGVKTGQTAKAGSCLILSAARSVEIKKEGEVIHATPRRLIVVVLNAPDRFRAGESLLIKGWNAYDSWAAQGRPLDKKTTL